MSPNHSVPSVEEVIEDIESFSRHRVSRCPGGEEYEVKIDNDVFVGYFSETELRGLWETLREET